MASTKTFPRLLLLLLLLATISHLASAESSCSAKWLPQLPAAACFRDSLATRSWKPLPDDMSCLWRAEVAAASVTDKDNLLVQWNSNTRSCLLLEHDKVCGEMIADSSSSCVLYRRNSQRLRFAASIDKKFLAAWLFDANANSRSVICRSGSSHLENAFHPKNIVWKQEGAVFNGANSLMLMNNSKLTFPAGFTWLARVKRTPKKQPFIDSADCADMTRRGSRLWEWSQPKRLWFNSNGVLLPQENLESIGFQMTSNSNEWINIGATGSSASGSMRLFYGDRFLTASEVTRTLKGSQSIGNFCLILGWRWGGNHWLDGTMRTAAVANVTLSEAEIRRFFDSVP